MDLTESKKAVLIQKLIRGYLSRKRLILMNKEYAKVLERKVEKAPELGLLHSYSLSDKYFDYLQQETKNKSTTDFLIKNLHPEVILIVDEHKLLILPRVYIKTIKISKEQHSVFSKKIQDILIVSKTPDKRTENDTD